MFELETDATDAAMLLKRVKATARAKGILEEFYGNETESIVPVAGPLQIHREMLNVYQNLQMMNATWIISEKRLYSSRPVIGRLVVLCKRIFRKGTRWLLQPYYQQQTDFNGAATRTISDMIRVQEMLIQLYESELKGGEPDAG